jgi:trimethylamine--corrinoid protein Co-methyltransferase
MDAPVKPKRRGRAKTHAAPSKRDVNYRQLRNPFPVMSVFSDDEAANMHETALRMLEELGMRVLLPEARDLFAAGGARVTGDDMVHIGRDMVEAALKTAPRSIHCRAGAAHRDVTLELGALAFQPGAGAPHATDLRRGRRPGSASDFTDYTRLAHHFDVFQMMSPSVEPQDVPTELRHYFTTRTQVALTDKFPFLFARGTPQALDNFEMLRIARGVDEETFRNNVYSYTIINTNSPRTLDVPMAQGLIDFARAGQLSIVTPFTLMGAMAPITVAGAITLSHAECLAAITLTQLVKARRAGLLRHLHLERGHEVRRARLRHADAFPGLACRGADGADAGPALALGGRGRRRTSTTCRRRTRTSWGSGAVFWPGPPSSSIPPGGSKAG